MDDPNRPALAAVSKWKLYRKCRVCSNADMERPSQNQTHPDTRTRLSGKSKPGSHLTIDASGSFANPARGNVKHSFILTDHNTSYRMACPTTNKSCHTLLNEVKKWISHVGFMPETMWLKSIHTDNEYMCEPL